MSSNSNSNSHSDNMSEGEIVRSKNGHLRNGGDGRLPLLQKNIVKSTMRLERLNYHAAFHNKCMTQHYTVRFEDGESISVMATNDTRRTRLNQDIEKILKSSSRQIMKAICTYYEEAVGQLGQ